MVENDMWALFLRLFLTALLSTGGAFALLQFFGKKWIEIKFNKELESFKSSNQKELEILKAHNLYELNILTTRKVKWIEKEQEVLSTVWGKLVTAHNKSKQAVNLLRHTPDFRRMNSEEFESFLSKSDLNENEKEYLKSQDDKSKAYTKIQVVRELYEARKAFVDFHTFFQMNCIFIIPHVKLKFKEIDDCIWSALISKEVYLDLEEGKEFRDKGLEAYNKINKEVKGYMDEMELLLQEVLFPAEKTKTAP